MERLKTAFDFIFSSYKRASAALFVMAILLTIPITVTMIGNQQDIRQRASSLTCADLKDNYEDNKCDTRDTPLCTTIKRNLRENGCSIPGTTTTTTTSTNKDDSDDDRQICAEVITYAINKTTQECRVFSTSCLPDGWLADSACQNRITPTISPTIAAISPTATRTPTPTTGTGSSCSLRPKGDANCDNKVNMDDFNIWKEEFLATNTSLNINPWKLFQAFAQTSSSADFNFSGRVDTDDFNIWRDGFLNTSIAH